MYTPRLRLFLPSICAALLWAAVPAHAAAVSYTDPNAWAAATTGDQTINFNGIASTGQFTDESSSTGLVLSGFDFIGELTASTYNLQVVDSQYVNPFYNFGIGGALRSPAYDRAQAATFTPYIHVVFPTNTTAFATNLATVSPNGLTYQVTLSNGQIFTVGTGARPNLAFLGIASDTAITYADFTVLGTAYNGGSFGLIKTFQFGASDTAAQQTPEACTLILIGTGLLAFNWMRKRRKPAPLQPLVLVESH